jgi:ribosomal-protein-alanine N-acetyltransferase
MPEGQSLRPATPDDLPALLEIESQSHFSPWTRAHFEAEMAKPYARVLVLTDDETDTQVSGFIVSWLLLDEAQILNVAVRLSARGLGYGQFLVRQVVKEALAAGKRKVVLDVRKSNLPAIQLYQKVGFLISRVQKGFYASNGEDAYAMELPLQGADPAHVLDF